MTTIPWDIHQVHSSPYITSRKMGEKVNRHGHDRTEYPERKGRRVNFNSIVKTDSSLHFITKEEEQVVWYSSKELRDLSYKDRDMILTAKQLGHEENNGEFCLRGLETAFSRRAALDQRTRRLSIVKAVLFEQSEGIPHADPAQIRKKSLAISKEARHVAALNGQQDAETVRNATSFYHSYSENASNHDKSTVTSSGSIVIDHKTRTICL